MGVQAPARPPDYQSWLAIVGESEGYDSDHVLISPRVVPHHDSIVSIEATTRMASGLDLSDEPRWLEKRGCGK